MARPVIIVAVLLMLAAGARAGDPECTAAVQACQLGDADWGTLETISPLADIALAVVGSAGDGSAQYLCGNATKIQACFVNLTATGNACAGFTTNAAYVAATTATASAPSYLTIGAPTSLLVLLGAID